MRRLDFTNRAFLFLMVAGDNQSGSFYIYDRERSSFYSLSLPIAERYGGSREDEFESLGKILTHPLRKVQLPQTAISLAVYLLELRQPQRQVSGNVRTSRNNDAAGSMG